MAFAEAAERPARSRRPVFDSEVVDSLELLAGKNAVRVMRLLAEGVPVDLEAALVERHCGNAQPLMPRGLGWDYAHKGAHRLWRGLLGLIDVFPPRGNLGGGALFPSGGVGNPRGPP